MRCDRGVQGRCRGGARRFVFVTGDPVWWVAGPKRRKGGRNDGFATANATPPPRHRAYWRAASLVWLPSQKPPVVADCGYLYKDLVTRPAGGSRPMLSLKGDNGGGGGGGGDIVIDRSINQSMN